MAERNDKEEWEEREESKDSDLTFWVGFPPVPGSSISIVPWTIIRVLFQCLQLSRAIPHFCKALPYASFDLLHFSLWDVLFFPGLCLLLPLPITRIIIGNRFSNSTLPAHPALLPIRVSTSSGALRSSGSPRAPRAPQCITFNIERMPHTPYFSTLSHPSMFPPGLNSQAN